MKPKRPLPRYIRDPIGYIWDNIFDIVLIVVIATLLYTFVRDTVNEEPSKPAVEQVK